MSDPHDTPALDSFLEDVEKLRRGAELLEMLWTALGPYFACPVDMGALGEARQLRDNDEVWKIWGKVQDHFGFDDSE